MTKYQCEICKQYKIDEVWQKFPEGSDLYKQMQIWDRLGEMNQTVCPDCYDKVKK